MRYRDGIDQRGKLEISAAGVLLLAIATMVASGIVFLLGIYVGKGMVEQRLVQESRVVRLPVPTPGAAGSGSAKRDEVDGTFWDKLAKGEATPPPAAAPSPTAAETPVRVSPARSTPAPRPTEQKAAAPPTPVPTRQPPAVAEGGTFQIQVNAMADKARADELVHDLTLRSSRRRESATRPSTACAWAISPRGMPPNKRSRACASRAIRTRSWRPR